MKSDVWKYFSKLDGKTVKCDLCTKELAFHGTTTNLRNHLLRSHPDQYKRDDQDGGGPRQSKLIGISKKCSKARADKINQLLVNVVVKDIRPLRIVEDKGLRDLLLYLEPGYEPPSRKHLTKLLHDRYENANHKHLDTD